MPVDLNADVGESFGRWRLGDDALLLPHLSSANVACGFHAGDPATLLSTVTAAARAGVAVGAQVGYPDLVGFGRRAMDVDPDDLVADVLYQVGALDGLCRAAGIRVRYVKAHGALYHRITTDAGQADAVARAAATCGLPLLHAGDGAVSAAAQRHGVRLVREGFADRRYIGEVGASALVPRSTSGALIEDPDAAARQALALVDAGVESICVHGDTAGAAQIAAAVRSALVGRGFDVVAFA